MYTIRMGKADTEWLLPLLKSASISLRLTIRSRLENVGRSTLLYIYYSSCSIR